MCADESCDNEGKHSELASMVSHLIKQEMGKYLKGKQQEEHVSYANQVDFAGNSILKFVTDCYMPLNYDCWILDTGASSHMSFNYDVMQFNQ